MSINKQNYKVGQVSLYKQCPKCSTIIEKNDGCNELKCLNCQFRFCWLCLKEYEDGHYSYYNYSGCPGLRFSGNVF